MRARRRQNGFTLIELMLVIAMFTVLAALAWGNTHSQMPRYRLIRASKELKSDLVRLRNLAVETNRETRLSLQFSPGDCEDFDEWGGRWQLEIGDRSRRAESWDVLPADTEADGSDDEKGEGLGSLSDGGNREAKDVCLVQWETIHGPGSGNPDSIVFSPRGWLTNPSTDFNADGYLELTLTNQLAARMDVADRVNVLITRAGMVRLHSTLGREMTDNPVGIEASTTR